MTTVLDNFTIRWLIYWECRRTGKSANNYLWTFWTHTKYSKRWKSHNYLRSISIRWSQSSSRAHPSLPRCRSGLWRCIWRMAPLFVLSGCCSNAGHGAQTGGPTRQRPEHKRPALGPTMPVHHCQTATHQQITYTHDEYSLF